MELFNNKRGILSTEQPLFSKGSKTSSRETTSETISGGQRDNGVGGVTQEMRKKKKQNKPHNSHQNPTPPQSMYAI